LEASRSEAAFSLVTKAEVAASVVETTKKRKTDEAREIEKELELKTRQELEQLSEQEVEELEVLLDGGQGEREWSVHARARRKRQKFESSRMEEERRRWNFLWELEESWPMANSNGNGIKQSCCNSNSSNSLNNGSKNSISSSISIGKAKERGWGNSKENSSSIDSILHGSGSGSNSNMHGISNDSSHGISKSISNGISSSISNSNEKKDGCSNSIGID
jgi:hypothetical protein